MVELKVGATIVIPEWCPEGYIPLGKAGLYLGASNTQYIAKLVAADKMDHLTIDVDGKPHVVVSIAGLDAYKAGTTARGPRTPGGAKGKKGNQTPSYVQHVKSVKAAVNKMDIAEADKAVALRVLGDLLAGNIVRWSQAKQAASEASKTAEALKAAAQ